VAGYIPRWCTCPQTVTHPSINRAWRRVTSLIVTNALPLSQTTNPTCVHVFVCTLSVPLYLLSLLFIWTVLSKINNLIWFYWLIGIFATMIGDIISFTLHASFAEAPQSINQWSKQTHNFSHSANNITIIIEREVQIQQTQQSISQSIDPLIIYTYWQHLGYHMILFYSTVKCISRFDFSFHCMLH